MVAARNNSAIASVETHSVISAGTNRAAVIVEAIARTWASESRAGIFKLARRSRDSQARSDFVTMFISGFDSASASGAEGCASRAGLDQLGKIIGGAMPVGGRRGSAAKC